MKRRDLERRLRMVGCLLKREGASHSIWINPATGVKEAIPRHNEIKEPLARTTMGPIKPIAHHPPGQRPGAGARGRLRRNRTLPRRDRAGCVALRRHLQLMRFERLRLQALPFGEAAGWLTDDDVLAAVS